MKKKLPIFIFKKLLENSRPNQVMIQEKEEYGI